MSEHDKPRVIETARFYQPLDETSTSSPSWNPLARRDASGFNAVGPRAKSDIGSAMLESINRVREADQQHLHRPRGFWSRLTGQVTEREKRLAQHELVMTDQVCNAFAKELSLYCEALYLRASDEVNVWLAHHRIAARGQLIEFATGELQRLKETIEGRREQFTATIRARTKRLQNNRDLEVLVDAEIEDMRAELTEHLEFLRSLEQLFVAAVRERIG